MDTLKIAQSHPQDLVAQLAHDADQADALFTLLVMADASTPTGAAFRLAAMKFAFVYTNEGSEAVARKAARVAA